MASGERPADQDRILDKTQGIVQKLLAAQDSARRGLARAASARRAPVLIPNQRRPTFVSLFAAQRSQEPM